MRFVILSYIALLSLTLITCSVSHFKECANQLLSGDKDLQRKISTLEIDGNIPKVKDYMKCVFDASGWTQQGGKALDTSKVFTDMLTYGFDRQTELTEVVKECEAEFGVVISAADYLSCLLIDGRTKKEFCLMLMVKAPDFFKQNVC